MCSCIFQENGIVDRSSGEEWYILIGVRIEHIEDVRDVKDFKDFNLRTKELECN